MPEHTDTPDQPRRQTPTERLHELSMAIATRPSSAPESSVTISRNAKGVYQFEVTVRGADALVCRAEAGRIASDLAVAYPYPDAPQPEAAS